MRTRLLRLFYLTHPQVQIDPEIPVPQWGLSETGRNRTESFARSPLLKTVKWLVSSDETKAIETAEIIARHIDLQITIRPKMHENDRSATGYLTAEPFEKMRQAFFTRPEISTRGWERAVDAQARIVSEIEGVFATAKQQGGAGNILCVGHGAVGTLAYCHYANKAISTEHDQPTGGGNLFAMDVEPHRILHPWRAMEDFGA